MVEKRKEDSLLLTRFLVPIGHANTQGWNSHGTLMVFGHGHYFQALLVNEMQNLNALLLPDMHCSTQQIFK